MEKFKKNEAGRWNWDFYRSLYNGKYVLQLRSTRMNFDIEIGKREAQYLRNKMDAIVEESK